MSAPLRLIYDEDAAPPRAERMRLGSIDELEPSVRGLLREGFDGELMLRGPDTARICIYEGRIPWIRARAYPENLGDVLRRELGLPARDLARAIAHCRDRGLRLGEGMLALGLAMLVAVGWSQHLTEHAVADHQARIALADRIQQRVTMAHLWLEEALGGDSSIDLDRDVLGAIDEGLATVALMIGGGDAGLGVLLPPLDDPAQRAALDELGRRIRRWREQTGVRWETRHDGGGIGSAQDQAYDAYYEEILEGARGVQRAQAAALTDDRRMVRGINGGMMVGLLVMLAGVTRLVLRQQRSVAAKNAELEARVRERTAALLREARANKAQEVLLVIDQFEG